MSNLHLFEMDPTPYMFKKKPWKEYLRTLNPRPAWQITEDEIKTSDDHDEKSLKMMQEHSPGNYTLEKYYHEYHGYSYRLKFKTPAEETFFRLKYD
jgi:hypothetical protein